MAKKFALKNIGRPVGRAARYIGIGATAGALGSLSNSQAGLRREAAIQGAVTGASIGSIASFARPILKFGGQVTKRETVRAAKIAKRKGGVIFRRVRGRVIPIRVKNG